MKAYKIILTSFLVLLVSAITFYAANLAFSLVSNYEAISLTTMSGVPMFMFVAILFAFGFYEYKATFNKFNDAFAKRHYSLIIMILSLFGVVFSVLCGTIVYHSFTGIYVFKGYPLLMLIVHLIAIGVSTFVFIKSQIEIKKNNLVKERKSTFLHVLSTIGVALFAFFALERLGALVFLPTYFSSYDSIYVIPYYIQLLVPAALGLTFLIGKNLKTGKKFKLVSNFIILGYSILSFTYMLILRSVFDAYAPNYVNPLSAVQNLERLLKIPVNFIVMYLVSFITPVVNIILTLVKKNKK